MQNIPALSVNTMPADALASKVASASAGMVLAVYRWTICIVVPELIPSTWDKLNPRYEYIFYKL